MSDDIVLAREAITMLLTRNDDAAAWPALERDGWLEMLPEPDSWPMVDFVVAALGEIARLGRDVPLVPHLAAGALLAAASADPAAGRLGLLTDARVHAGRVTARAWGATASSTLVGELDGRCVRVPTDAVERRDDELLGPVGVQWVEFGAATAGSWELTDRLVLRHEALVAYLLAVETAAAMHDAHRRTVAYLKDRTQFGATLSTRQALQHRAVDMYAATMLTSAVLSEATVAWREGGDAQAPSWAAKVIAGRRGVWTLENAIHLHGGIGFTWELGLHLGLRRAQRARQLLGGPTASGMRVLQTWSATQSDTGSQIIDWAQRPRDRDPAATAGHGA